MACKVISLQCIRLFVDGKAGLFSIRASFSLYRYVAIMRPLQPRMSKRRNLAIAAVIWISSSLISCPMLLFFKTEEVRLHTYTHVYKSTVITFPLSLYVCVPILLPPRCQQPSRAAHASSVTPSGPMVRQISPSRNICEYPQCVCVWKEGRTHERSLLHSKLHWAVNQEIRETCSCYRIIIARRNAATRLDAIKSVHKIQMAVLLSMCIKE